jgi:hypothetical protein
MEDREHHLKEKIGLIILEAKVDAATYHQRVFFLLDFLEPRYF